jgi:hypothetical protein
MKMILKPRIRIFIFNHICYYLMKSPLTRSLRKQTPMSKKAIPYVTAEKIKSTHMKNVLTVFLLFFSLIGIHNH